MLEETPPSKILLYLTIGVSFLSLLILVKELFFRPKHLTIPQIGLHPSRIEMNWDLLRKTLVITSPELKVDLKTETISTSPMVPIDLIAEVPGLIDGPFIYRFDCENDGKYELETERTFEKYYTAKGVCQYNREGSYTARVEVETDITYYKAGEQVTENRKADDELNILAALINNPPVVSFCDVNPLQGTTQVDFKFSFQAEASDPDGDTLSYKWDFGDGLFSTEQNPLHVYRKEGFYVPKVIVSDGQGGETPCVVRSLITLEEFMPFEEITQPKKIGRENPFEPYKVGVLEEPKATTTEATTTEAE